MGKINGTGQINASTVSYDIVQTDGKYLMNAGQTNAPEASSLYWLEVIVKPTIKNYILQRATRATANVVYQREYTGSAWTAWVQTYPCVLT